MALNNKLFKEICITPGVPGYEHKIRALVLKEIKKLADKIWTDNMGNVFALKKGKSDKKVMASAHMDEIGFIVKHIDEKGFIKFHTLGGFDPKTLTAQRVTVHGKKDIHGVMGCKPIHVMSPEERKKQVEIKDFFVDTGMTKKEVEKSISVGDTITRFSDFFEMGECINCKSLDNRVSVFILIEALRKLKKPAYDFYAVFSVQEEVGIRGASVAAHAVNPDFGIGLDTTVAFDSPGAKAEENVTRLGDGAAIKIMDSSTICDSRMVDFMKQTAKKHKIKNQLEILTAGGTDTAGLQRMGKNGSIAGAISVPTRYLHQIIEMANSNDIQDAIDLLVACANDMDKYDWKLV